MSTPPSSAMGFPSIMLHFVGLLRKTFPSHEAWPLLQSSLNPGLELNPQPMSSFSLPQKPPRTPRWMSTLAPRQSL